MIGALAKFFHFQPSELMEMDSDDLHFWSERANVIAEQMKKER